jgi:hypothetical protein
LQVPRRDLVIMLSNKQLETSIGAAEKSVVKLIDGRRKTLYSRCIRDL